MSIETTYRIKHNGHEWWTTDPETAQLFTQKGATVTAETTDELSRYGVRMNRLSREQLQDMRELARAMDWTHVSHMVGNYQQKRGDQ